MYIEELNRKLTQKLQIELDEYKKEFLKLSKEEMLDHIEEYFNRYMITKTIPMIDDVLFKPKYYEAMLAIDNPLETIGQVFDKSQKDWSGIVEDVIMELAAPDEYNMFGD